jgi:LPXTG-motif cell wall-anchored protein
MNANYGITSRTRIATVALTCALATAGLGLASTAPAWATEGDTENTATEQQSASIGFYLSNYANAGYTDSESNTVLYKEIAAQEGCLPVSVAVTNNLTQGSALAEQVNVLCDEAALAVDSELTAAAYQRAAELSLLASDIRPDGSFFTSVNSRVVAEVAFTTPAGTDAATAVAALSAERRAELTAGDRTFLGCASTTVGETTYWVVLFANDDVMGSAEAPANGETTVICNVAADAVANYLQGGTLSLAVGKSATIDVAATVTGSVTCGNVTAYFTNTEATVPGWCGAFSWNASNGNVSLGSADANTNGLITGVADGTTIVTLSTGGYTATYNVTVGSGKAADAVDLGTCTISGITSQTYTGEAITPAFVVITEAGDTIDPNTYTVAYENNVEVGTATVTVTAKVESPLVKGSVSTTFQIGAATVTVPDVAGQWIDAATAALADAGFIVEEQPGDMADAEAGTTAYQVYATSPAIGEAVEPGSTLTVYYYADPNIATAATLEDDILVDEGGEPTDASEGEDEQQPEATTTDLAAAIADGSVTVAAIADQTYTGGELTPVPTVMLGDTALAAGTDYTLAYANNVNAGTASVTITGAGSYSGSYTLSFTIAPRSIAGFSIAPVATQTYTGQELYPAITVTDGTTTLVAGTDFSIGYEQNVNAGTGHIVVEAGGNYTGTIDGTFVIAPVNINQATVTMPNVAYTGQPLSPVPVSVTIGDLTLVAGTDYSVLSYTGNTNVGDAKVTLKGEGNFTGTVTANWKVVSQGTANAGTTQTLPKTGDTTNIVPVVVGCVVGVALVVAAVILIVRSRSSKKDRR